MAASPSKKESEESGVQSPEESDPPMDRDAHDTQGLPYELEVKEQDRWLPIANGSYLQETLLFFLFRQTDGHVWFVNVHVAFIYVHTIAFKQ